MSRAFSDYYDVYDELFPKARKEHVCAACKATIRVGDRYARVFILWERKASHIKRCLRCQHMHEHLRTLAPDELWPDERLDCGEEYEQHWDTPPPEDIAALAFMTDDEAQRVLAPKPPPAPEAVP